MEDEVSSRLQDLLTGRMTSDVELVRADESGMDTVTAFEAAMTRAKDIESRFSQYSVKARDLTVAMDIGGAPYLKLKDERRLWFSPWAFSQFGDRIGMGATQYMMNCLRQGEFGLVPLNMNSWLAKNRDKEMFLRVYDDDTIKAVLSNKYSVFNHSDVLRGLAESLEIGRYQLQSYSITPDNMMLKLIDPEKVVVERRRPDDGDGSTAGMSIRNGLTGMSGVIVEFMIYTFICSNGLIVAGDWGKVFARKHYGMTYERFVAGVSQALGSFPEYVMTARQGVEKARKTRLDLEKRFGLFDLIKREVNCSDKMIEKIKDVMENNWEKSVWGLSGAITEVAQSLSVERQYEFERFAGVLMHRLAAQ